MRALVSGASGHIGAFVTRELVARGAEVHILVRPSSDLWRLSDSLLGDVTSQITVHRADFVDEAALAEIVAKAKPEATFHLAWEGITADARNAANQIPRNIVRTLQLLEAVRNGGCQCFIGVGSQAEYGARGPQNPGWDELFRGETGGISAYGLSKLCVGLLCQKFCELAGMRSVWLRLLATYGPQDDARHLLPSVINQLLEGSGPH
jgi:nucleoside-diphosphate-sugar epimerase